MRTLFSRFWLFVPWRGYGGRMQYLARPEGLEPPAYWFEASRSIQLSYGRARC